MPQSTSTTTITQLPLLPTPLVSMPTTPIFTIPPSLHIYSRRSKPQTQPQYSTTTTSPLVHQTPFPPSPHSSAQQPTNLQSPVPLSTPSTPASTPSSHSTLSTSPTPRTMNPPRHTTKNNPKYFGDKFVNTSTLHRLPTTLEPITHTQAIKDPKWQKLWMTILILYFIMELGSSFHHQVTNPLVASGSFVSKETKMVLLLNTRLASSPKVFSNNMVLITLTLLDLILYTQFSLLLFP